LDVPFLVWGGLAAAIVVFVVIDLFVLHRGHHKVSLREAAIGTVGWTVLGLAFTGVVALLGDRENATEYVTGYLLEKTLSLDNVAVFAVLFTGFAVPELLRSRLLSIGVLAALALRIVFIAAGLVVLNAAHAVLYGFGALLVVTGVRMMARRGHEESPPRDSRVLALLGRVIPLTPDYDGDRYLTRRRSPGGRLRRHATPLLAAIIAIAAADVVFAVDSIPAVFGVTTEPFLVVSANAFAVLGLRPTYFLLAGAMDRFVHLQTGLAIVLLGVGAKMLLADVVHIPVWVNLAGVVTVLGVSILTSLRSTAGSAQSGRHRQAVDGGLDGVRGVRAAGLDELPEPVDERLRGVGRS
jgi:tellurite resistance protein TerC